MIWLLQVKIMKLFHCSQVNLDREYCTNLKNPGTVVSIACDCNYLFPRWSWRLSSEAPKSTLPVLSADFTTLYNQLRPCNTQLFCTRFPRSFLAVQSTILHCLCSVLQVFFSFPNLCNSTVSFTLISLFSILEVKTAFSAAHCIKGQILFLQETEKNYFAVLPLTFIDKCINMRQQPTTNRNLQGYEAH